MMMEICIFDWKKIGEPVVVTQVDIYLGIYKNLARLEHSEGIYAHINHSLYR